jgi:hypothetical protein
LPELNVEKNTVIKYVAYYDLNVKVYIFILSLSSLAETVPYKRGHFNSKKLMLQEGQALPATFSYAKDRFIFVVQRDLTVTFNGTK